MHQNYLKFPCFINNCNFWTETKEGLQSHIITYHPKFFEEYRFECANDGCKENFDSTDQLENHRILAHKRFAFCKRCGTIFPFLYMLMIHNRKHETDFEKINSLVNVETKKTVTKENAEAHRYFRTYCEQNIEKCKKIKEFLQSNPTYNDNECIAMQKNNLKLACLITNCKSRFAWKSDLKRHINIKHPKFFKEYRFECAKNGCKENFDSSDQLENHRILKHGSFLFCKRCNKTFSYFRMLISHNGKYESAFKQIETVQSQSHQS